MMNKVNYIFFIILSILLQSLNAIFKKYAATTLHDVTLFTIMTNLFYLLALVCLFLQAIVWQQALNHYPLSVAYPFMSLVSFVVLIASAVLFHEGITVANIAGLVFISVGITVLSRDAKEGYIL
jgi:multidrug transporter EmrE-like cation transporter